VLAITSEGAVAACATKPEEKAEMAKAIVDASTKRNLDMFVTPATNLRQREPLSTLKTTGKRQISRQNEH
jgi:hypothetical protein